MRSDIAVDAPLENRPGVPMEKSPPAPVASAARDIPPQAAEIELLVEPDQELTPVFGTAAPPRGVSGVIRRAAYRFPDYRVRRWLLLLVADRVEAEQARWAQGVRGSVVWLAGGVALALGGMVLLAGRR